MKLSLAASVIHLPESWRTLGPSGSTSFRDNTFQMCPTPRARRLTQMETRLVSSTMSTCQGMTSLDWLRVRPHLHHVKTCAKQVVSVSSGPGYPRSTRSVQRLVISNLILGKRFQRGESSQEQRAVKEVFLCEIVSHEKSSLKKRLVMQETQ